MHLFKQQGLSSEEQSRAPIPVIDIGAYLAGEPGGLERAAAELRDASENVGFFYVAGHGVPQELIDAAFAASQRFHAQTMEEKLAVRINANNIGYLPMAGSLGASSTVHKNTKPNLNESFFITHDRPADHPDVIAEKPLRSQNQWPAAEAEIRGDMTAYFRAVHGLADKLVELFAVSLDLPQGWFEEFFANESNATMRFLHYPPQEVIEENQFGTAPHTDNSFLTILARTQVPGLAVRLPNEKWFIPPLIPGTFLVNLGNILRRWSNNTYLSTPHGVINDSGLDRYSIAFFHNPNPQAVIAPVPTRVTAEHPAEFEPELYLDLALAFYRANYLHQKKAAEAEA
jgi:isopenicillin N synthase-like dioxygenase